MPTRIVSASDGQRITVNTLVKRPTLIQARQLRMLDQQFIVDALLRDAGGVPAGALVYYESTPQFADTDPEIVDEFGEIPLTTGQVGQPQVALSVKRMLGGRISQEMINRNAIDRVNLQMTQIRNTTVRAWEDAFLSLVLSNVNLNTYAAVVPWDQATSKIRFDIGQAAKLVAQAASDGPGGSNRFGFDPNTLVISEDTSYDFLVSDEVNNVFKGSPLAAQAPQYTGVLPNKFYRFTIMKSWRLASNQALLLERNTIGGIANERPTWATPLYPQSRSNETFRWDTGRQSVMFVDQPKAACLITGV